LLVLQLALRTGLLLLEQEQVYRTEMVPELRQKAHLTREQVRVVHQINLLTAQVRLQIRLLWHIKRN
jgi:hypothetical protein